MKLPFYKYHGTGNDFVMIDNREGAIQLSNRQVQEICQRHLGVGSDGLVLIEPSETCDFHMNFYNPDASQSFCGNGSRCAVAFAHSLGLIGDYCTFTAIDGTHEAKLLPDGNVSVKMGDVSKIEKRGEDSYVNTGSPHYVQFVKDVDGLDLIPHARSIRYNEEWSAQGVNVNVLEKEGTDTVRMRTYERGVEDETLSCGTGVTAAALAMASKHDKMQGKIQVNTRGGKLSVTFERHNAGYKNIWLKGPAVLVFKGEMEL